MNEHELRAIARRWTANALAMAAVLVLLVICAVLDAERELAPTTAPAMLK